MAKSSSRFVGSNFKSASISESFYAFTRFKEAWTVYEICKTALLSITLLPIRIVILLIGLLCFYLISAVLNCHTTVSRKFYSSSITTTLPLWKAYLYQTIPYFGLAAAWAFGIYNINCKYLTYQQMKDKYGYKNAVLPKHQKCCTIISNHVSFLDIPILMYLFSASFVAKEEVATTPFFGAISRCIHTLFLRKTHPLTATLSDRIELLNNHQCKDGEQCMLCIFPNLVVFPEGTTTNGRALIAFRSGVFRACKHYAVRPVAMFSNNRCVDYNFASLPPLNLVFRLLTQFRNDLNVVVGAPYVPNEEEIANPLLYAKNVNILISKMLNDAPIYVLNTQHKKECYFEYLLPLWAGQISEAQIKLVRQRATDILNRDQTLQFYLKAAKYPATAR